MQVQHVEELTVRAASDLLRDAPAGEGAVEPRGPQGAQEKEDAQEPQDRVYSDESVGLGIDIVEISRMAETLKRSPSFAERVFSPD